MKKIYGDYSFFPGKMKEEDAYRTIPGVFNKIYDSLIRGIILAGGKPDLSKIEIIYHTPDDYIGSPLDINPVSGGIGEIGTTIAVKMRADFEEE